MIIHAYSCSAASNRVYMASTFLLFLLLVTQTLSSVLTAMKMELTEEAKQEWLTRSIGCQGNVQGFFFSSTKTTKITGKWPNDEIAYVCGEVSLYTKYHLRSFRNIITKGVKYLIFFRSPQFRNLEIEVVEMYKNHGKTHAGCVHTHCVCTCRVCAHALCVHVQNQQNPATKRMAL